MSNLKPVPKIGDEIGWWTVLAGPHKRGSNPYWLCQCRCGTQIDVSQGSLRRRGSSKCKKCGGRSTETCRRFAHLTRRVYYKLKHIVEHAMSRCNDATSPNYKYYGRRGIEVRFDNEIIFIEYLLTLPGYDDFSLVIDRVDNNGHYEVGNLRFATRTESSRNRRPYRKRGVC